MIKKMSKRRWLWCLIRYRGHYDLTYGLHDGESAKMTVKEIDDYFKSRRVKCDRCGRVKIIMPRY